MIRHYFKLEPNSLKLKIKIKDGKMANIPKKVTERFSKTVKKYQKILITAKNKDINEADTVSIISNILHDVFGYDQYEEITREFAIKGTYCDLAIKVEGDVKFLIEVKAIGINLNEKHIRQATHYGADKGIEWIVLTNGIDWIIYKMSYGNKIAHTQICRFDFTELNLRDQQHQDHLFILCKEGLKRAAIEEFHAYKKIVNRFYISAILMGDSVTDLIRKELKKSSSGIKFDDKEIESILKNEVLKREVVDSDYAQEAIDQYKTVLKQIKRASKKKLKSKAEVKTGNEEPQNENVEENSESFEQISI